MTDKENLVCIDWGTSSLRAYLVNKNGTILEERSFPWGVKKLPINSGTREDNFKNTFISICEGWLNGNTPVIICGMATSTIGWKETPYVPCPASLNDVTAGMMSFFAEENHIHLIPGLVSEVTTPDVMRGEETQIFGSISLEQSEDKLICMPGTHSKWAVVQQSSVIDFTTFMTGEVFDILCNHSILVGDNDLTSGFSQEAFMKGIRVNKDNDNLLSSLFSTRSLSVRGRLKGDETKSYLSGLIIGNEIYQAKKYIKEHSQISCITLIGGERLCELYSLAINELMPEVNIDMNEHAAVTGMWQMAINKGLI